jgi:hypothetical protein
MHERRLRNHEIVGLLIHLQTLEKENVRLITGHFFIIQKNRLVRLPDSRSVMNIVDVLQAGFRLNGSAFGG